MCMYTHRRQWSCGSMKKPTGNDNIDDTPKPKWARATSIILHKKKSEKKTLFVHSFQHFFMLSSIYQALLSFDFCSLFDCFAWKNFEFTDSPLTHSREREGWWNYLLSIQIESIKKVILNDSSTALTHILIGDSFAEKLARMNEKSWVSGPEESRCVSLTKKNKEGIPSDLEELSWWIRKSRTRCFDLPSKPKQHEYNELYTIYYNTSNNTRERQKYECWKKKKR